MTEFPKDLHYSDTHEWLRPDGDDEFTLGITDYAQSQLGDIVFVDLPEKGDHPESGDEIAVIESVKTAADVYIPVTGEIIEVNESLKSDPSLVNHDPYGDGWLFRIKIDDTEELGALLDAQTYQEKISEE